MGFQKTLDAIDNIIAIAAYRFSISQHDESNPVLEVFDNTTDATITWVRESVGKCVGTASLPIFSAVPCIIPQHRTIFRSGTDEELYTLYVTTESATTMSIIVKDFNNELADDVLNTTPIEVYLNTTQA